MATADFRFVFRHTKAGKVIATADQKLITCNIDAEGRPIYSDVITRLTNSSKLKGDNIEVDSYVRLDRDQDVPINILS